MLVGLRPRNICGEGCRLERRRSEDSGSKKTQCLETRGFILSTLRGGAVRNQNQIAMTLGFNRTVVHRAIKTMVREGLVSEKKVDSGKALLIQLTANGTKYRERLLESRREAEKKLRKKLTAEECSQLLRLLM
jgi:DNA-binding MarR family transcriptional regulator